VTEQPAATLLVPYFEVDLANAQGTTTMFQINNASATAILANVTVWSDLGIPVTNFKVYLTGYDMQTVDLRAVLNGILPRTASDGQDPSDTISPQGWYSQDINFASCTGILPPPATLDATTVAHMRNALTGKFSSVAGGCVGVNYGAANMIARGYVTVDTVNSCTAGLPSDAGYFVSGGGGFATNQNTLWGDFTIMRPNQTWSASEPVVHVTASATDPETSTAGQYTFYGRFVGWTAADNREPLSTTFGVRYFNNGGPGLVPQNTTLLVWRDSKNSDISAFSCGTPPAWYPLDQEGAVAFDEAEEAATVSTSAFGASTQAVPVAPLTAFTSGWMFLNLNHNVESGADPSEDAAAAQAWVSAIHTRRFPVRGRYAVGAGATPFDSAKVAQHYTPGI
jgi:hypothetical protein